MRIHSVTRGFDRCSPNSQTGLEKARVAPERCREPCAIFQGSDEQGPGGQHSVNGPGICGERSPENHGRPHTEDFGPGHSLRVQRPLVLRAAFAARLSVSQMKIISPWVKIA